MTSLEPMHISGVTQHQGCPRAWRLGDRDWGLGYRPRRENVHLRLGSLYHDIAETYYTWVIQNEQRKPFPGVVDDIIYARSKEHRDRSEDLATFITPDIAEQWDKDERLIYAMFKGYVEWAGSSQAGPYNDENLHYLETEVKWQRSLVTPAGYSISLEGKIDAVAQDQDGIIWGIEHKTSSSLKRDLGSMVWEDQPLLYTWALREMFPKQVVGGFLYNWVLKADPFDIPILKSRLPSKAVKSTVHTTHNIYKATLKAQMDELGLEGQERADVIEKYKPSLDYLLYEAPPLYVREVFQVTDEQISTTLVNISQELTRMLQDSTVGVDYVPRYRSRFRCPRCAYRYVCQAVDDGADYQSLLDEFFYVDRRDVEEDDQE